VTLPDSREHYSDSASGNVMDSAELARRVVSGDLVGNSAELATRLLVVTAERDAALARVRQVEQERDDARWERDELARLAYESNESEKRLEAQLDRLEKALSYYADEDTGSEDGGDRAREALAAGRPEETEA
jgi:hypothetical protein